ncbi:hypothetical protein BJV78DRAFT_183623 [Lactifluus subvellereus]|nr:hypothetical protein BJV78DRAFT_183623 [Lactifluus subvellereus]
MEETKQLRLTLYMPPRTRCRRTGKRVAIVQSHHTISKYFRHTTISTLPDVVLLEIFSHYRAARVGSWPRSQSWWYKLVHVCRRWRQLVFASPLRLNLQLSCTFGVRVPDMINHSPPFPIVLDYGPRRLETWTAEDKDGFLFALQYLQRASEIVLSAPESILRMLTAGIVDEAPRLEHLSLHSQTAELVLPKQFLDGGAPQLRVLTLTGVSLATLHPLLPSATSLKTLALERIPSPAYFSPDCLVSHIRTMVQLETLSISFLSTVPRPGFMNERFLPWGPLTRVELPALTQLIYRGVSAYVEALLMRIRTPLIEDVEITLFYQLTLGLPRTGAFLSQLETFRPSRARIDFSEVSTHVIVSAPQPTNSPDITLSVSCAQLDFQVSGMAQICNGLPGALLPVEDLTLGFHEGKMPEEWRDSVDPALWRALLTRFRRVGTLRVHVALAGDLERALRPQTDGAGGPLIEQGLDVLLPDLHTLVLLHGSDKHALTAASDALSGFVEERGHGGHPVKVELQDLSRLWKRTRP